jgi:hypothetical protein
MIDHQGTPCIVIRRKTLDTASPGRFHPRLSKDFLDVSATEITVHDDIHRRF